MSRGQLMPVANLCRVAVYHENYNDTKIPQLPTHYSRQVNKEMRSASQDIQQCLNVPPKKNR